METQKERGKRNKWASWHVKKIAVNARYNYIFFLEKYPYFILLFLSNDVFHDLHVALLHDQAERICNGFYGKLQFCKFYISVNPKPDGDDEEATTGGGGGGGGGAGDFLGEGARLDFEKKAKIDFPDYGKNC